jgi:hypothetical protein
VPDLDSEENLAIWASFTMDIGLLARDRAGEGPEGSFGGVVVPGRQVSHCWQAVITRRAQVPWMEAILGDLHPAGRGWRLPIHSPPREGRRPSIRKEEATEGRRTRHRLAAFKALIHQRVRHSRWGVEAQREPLLSWRSDLSRFQLYNPSYSNPKVRARWALPLSYKLH